jgi:hypothetical protein
MTIWPLKYLLLYALFLWGYVSLFNAQLPEWVERHQENKIAEAEALLERRREAAENHARQLDVLGLERRAEFYTELSDNQLEVIFP